MIKIISLGRALRILPKGQLISLVDLRISPFQPKNAAGTTSREFLTGFAQPSSAADHRYDSGLRILAPEPRSNPTFPCQISYDTRTVPSGTGPSRWYNAMLGRSNFVDGNTGVPIVQTRPSDAGDSRPPIPTFNLPIDCAVSIRCTARCSRADECAQRRRSSSVHEPRKLRWWRWRLRRWFPAWR